MQGMAVFVRGALPGDVARIRLTKAKKNFAEAEAIKIVTPSPWRVQARCEHFGVCGGCISQDLTYQKQLDFKTQQVKENLQHIGGLDLEVRPARGMTEPWHYRNKMEFAFGEAAGQVYLGLMKRGAFDQVVPINVCHLATPRAMQAVRLVESFVRQHDLHAFDPRTRSGTLRHLVVREGMRTGDLMLNLVTTSATAPMPELVEAVSSVTPTTVLWSHTDTWGAVVRGDTIHVLSGPGEITERVGHLTLYVGPFSFLQTNSEMVEVLYGEIDRQAALIGDEAVLDMYCGVGSIGLYLARQARQVAGIESAPEAITYAERNAIANGVSNAEFQCAQVEALSSLTLEVISPDIVILDPPRAGLHARLMESLREMKTRRLLYISCNPAALARDLKALADMYNFGHVQPVDMFPHTWHIESVVTLTRKE